MKIKIQYYTYKIYLYVRKKIVKAKRDSEEFIY
jgi:hypothetical protein